jgi:hypothetical protein
MTDLRVIVERGNGSRRFALLERLEDRVMFFQCSDRGRGRHALGSHDLSSFKFSGIRRWVSAIRSFFSAATDGAVQVGFDSFHPLL